jgi:hypothetical protein
VVANAFSAPLGDAGSGSGSGAGVSSPVGVVDGVEGVSTTGSSNAASAAVAGQSMMREWVDELTGRSDRGAGGLRAPSESEISQVMSMFPDMRREDVVGALQRRCVSFPPLLSVVRPSLSWTSWGSYFLLM